MSKRIGEPILFKEYGTDVILQTGIVADDIVSGPSEEKSRLVDSAGFNTETILVVLSPCS